MIEFTSENRPTCEPTNQAECTLNWAALQDVWDALSCFSTAMVYDGCAILEGEIAKDDPSVPADGITLTLAKATYGDNDDSCYYDVYLNGLSALVTPDSDADFPSYSVADIDDDNFEITIIPGALAVADASLNFVYQIKVRKYKTFLDRINECEAEVNCRDL